MVEPAAPLVLLLRRLLQQVLRLLDLKSELAREWLRR